MSKERKPRKWVIGYMNSKYAVVSVGGKVRIIEPIKDPVLKRTLFRFYSQADLGLKYSNKVVEVYRDGKSEPDLVPWVDIWLSSEQRRQYQGIVFDPSSGHTGFFNLWCGFSVNAREGDAKLFLDFVKDIICGGDKEAYHYLMAYLAHMVQRPRELPGTALVLLGRQGVGKGFFMQQVGALIANHYVQLTQAKHLTGNFNGHLAHALLVFADEGSFTRQYSANILKSRISEPTFLMEQKGIDAVPVANFMRLVIASNEEHVIRAQFDERRYAVMSVSDARQGDTKYFAELARHMEEGGREAFMQALMSWDLNEVDIRTVPKTRALVEQKMLSMTVLDRWWYERLHAGVFPQTSTGWPRQLAAREVMRDVEDFGFAIGSRGRSLETQVGKFLKRMVPGLQHTRPGGKRSYVFPPLADCRAAFDRATGVSWEWASDEDQ